MSFSCLYPSPVPGTLQAYSKVTDGKDQKGKEALFYALKTTFYNESDAFVEYFGLQVV